MDNQNANNSGLSQGQNPPNDSKQPPIHNTNNGTENLRSRSVIETSREVAEKELAVQEAYNAQILRQQQAEARRNKVAGVTVKIILVLLGLIIFVALIWMAVEIISHAGSVQGDDCKNDDGTIKTSCCDRPEYQDSIACKEGPGKKSTIDGYQCQTDNCKKMTDIIKDELIVIYDTKFYLYDIKNKETTATAIDNSIDYNSMSSFEWGAGKYYVIMQPMTGELGLYSVADNAQIISNTVSRFYSDLNHNAYKNMTDVYGKYIIAREDSQYRLYDLSNGGKRLASGANGVYIYGGYIITFESDGSRRAYTESGDQIFIAQVGEEIYVKDSFVLHVKKSGHDAYDKYGTKQKAGENKVLTELRSVKATELTSYLNDSKNKFYRMPTTRDYSD